jgi:hypothetical protein
MISADNSYLRLWDKILHGLKTESINEVLGGFVKNANNCQICRTFEITSSTIAKLHEE